MYIDKEDRDVITMCNENKRRSSLTTVVGYIMPQKEAMEYAVSKAVQKRQGLDWQSVGFLVLATLAVIVATVATVGG